MRQLTPPLTTLIIITVLLLTLFPALTPAWAGEQGVVSCTAPGCGYQAPLTIGGGRNSPYLTGYCGSRREFIRIKLNSWDEYRQRHYCPEGKEIVQPIYDGSQVKHFPCPRCGRRTLNYKRKILFD